MDKHTEDAIIRLDKRVRSYRIGVVLLGIGLLVTMGQFHFSRSPESCGPAPDCPPMRGVPVDVETTFSYYTGADLYMVRASSFLHENKSLGEITVLNIGLNGGITGDYYTPSVIVDEWCGERVNITFENGDKLVCGVGATVGANVSINGGSSSPVSAPGMVGSFIIDDLRVNLQFHSLDWVSGHHLRIYWNAGKVID